MVRRAIDAGQETPVLTRAPESLPVGAYHISLPGRSRPLAAQVFEDRGRWLAAVADSPLPEGRHALRPVPADSRSDEGGVRLVPEGPNLRFELLGRLFTRYTIDAGAKPFFFPLIGPTGTGYTRAYPMEDVVGEDRDHPHQRSLWFTHGDVNGVDFWSEQKGHGTIRETGRKIVVEGPVAGRLRTSDDWIGPDGRRVCADDRVVTVFRAEGVRVVDFEITLTAVEGPVRFGDTKEGMFGLRVASSMDVNKKRGGKILNAEGLADDRAWGKASAWVDYTGPVGGKTVGIAILNHPRSFRHPTTWHVRTYGLFAANPFGWHDFGRQESGEHTLRAGESLWFGYRVILHEGDTAAANVAAQYVTYADAPTVEREGE